MKTMTHIGLGIGLLLLVTLLIWQGVMDVIQLLLSSGWGLLWLPLIWAPSLFIATHAWHILFKPGQAPDYRQALLAMWMGRAVNGMLPVATIGGEIVKARVITLWGIKGTDASASVIVDKTVQVIAVLVWGLIGISLLAYLSLDNHLAVLALPGVAFLSLSLVGLFLLQKAGMFTKLAHLGEKLIPIDSWEGIRISAREVDAGVMAIYRSGKTVFKASLFKTLSMIVQSAEVWLACYLLGYPIGLLEAVMLKSVTSTLSDLAFIIPNAYGVQEGAFVLIGGLVGLTPDVSLALSLAIRIRDVILDPSGLFALQQIESRQLLRRSSTA